MKVIVNIRGTICWREMLSTLDEVNEYFLRGTDSFSLKTLRPNPIVDSFVKDIESISDNTIEKNLTDRNIEYLVKCRQEKDNLSYIEAISKIANEYDIRKYQDIYNHIETYGQPALLNEVGGYMFLTDEMEVLPQTEENIQAANSKLDTTTFLNTHFTDSDVLILENSFNLPKFFKGKNYSYIKNIRKSTKDEFVEAIKTALSKGIKTITCQTTFTDRDQINLLLELLPPMHFVFVNSSEDNLPNDMKNTKHTYEFVQM